MLVASCSSSSFLHEYSGYNVDTGNEILQNHYLSNVEQVESNFNDNLDASYLPHNELSVSYWGLNSPLFHQGIIPVSYVVSVPGAEPGHISPAGGEYLDVRIKGIVFDTAHQSIRWTEKQITLNVDTGTIMSS